MKDFAPAPVGDFDDRGLSRSDLVREINRLRDLVDVWKWRYHELDEFSDGLTAELAR